MSAPELELVWLAAEYHFPSTYSISGADEQYEQRSGTAGARPSHGSARANPYGSGVLRIGSHEGCSVPDYPVNAGPH